MGSTVKYFYFRIKLLKLIRGIIKTNLVMNTNNQLKPNILVNNIVTLILNYNRKAGINILNPSLIKLYRFVIKSYSLKEMKNQEIFTLIRNVRIWKTGN